MRMRMRAGTRPNCRIFLSFVIEIFMAQFDSADMFGKSPSGDYVQRHLNRQGR